MARRKPLADFNRLMAYVRWSESWKKTYIDGLAELGSARFREGDESGSKRAITRASIHILSSPDEMYDTEYGTIEQLARIYLDLGDEKSALREVALLRFESDKETVLGSVEIQD